MQVHMEWLTGCKNTRQALKEVLIHFDTRDPYTSEHQKKVSNLSRAIARELELPCGSEHAVAAAGLLHDIGKAHVPYDILVKPGRVNEYEYTILKTHVQKGYDILKSIGLPSRIADIVLQHHERINGSGYPSGLGGETILFEAKILGVADVVEAVASHRPYRPAMGIDAALQEVWDNSNLLYDEDVANACIRLFYHKGYVLTNEFNLDMFNTFLEISYDIV